MVGIQSGWTLSACEVFLDFDNTMTSCDVLDAIIRHFATDRSWELFEADWQAGRIGSRECLEGQLRSVRVTKTVLAQYLASVALDPHAASLLALLRRHGVEPVILTDNFSFIVEQVLQRHGIRDVRVVANRLRFSGNRLHPSFPYQDERCARGCGHCKRSHLLESHARGRTAVYVGDGRSDLCPAEEADVVFAKGHLLQALRASGRPHLAFHDLGDVVEELTARGAPCL